MITQNDIDVMSDIERRVNLYKNIGLYGGAGVTAAYGRFYRKPPWPVWRTFGYSTLASMVGLGASSIISIRVLFRGLNRLENKDRFNAAVRAMKEDRNQNSKTGPYRPYQHQPAENDDATVDDSSGASWAGASDAPVQAPEPKGSTSALPEEGSRWADIRTARGTAKQSTWDAIRERNMKANLPSPNGSTSGATSPGGPRLSHTDSNTTGPNGKTSEQEKFDVLLGAERNFGKEEDSTWKESRWS